MSDFLIDKISTHLAASKSAAWRERVITRFSTFVAFLQENHLTTRTILDPGSEPEVSLRIMKSDLTDEGYEVVKAAYDKWLRGIDKGKDVSDLTTLEKALEKIRGRSS